MTDASHPIKGLKYDHLSAGSPRGRIRPWIDGGAPDAANSIDPLSDGRCGVSGQLPPASLESPAEQRLGRRGIDQCGVVILAETVANVGSGNAFRSDPVAGRPGTCIGCGYPDGLVAVKIRFNGPITRATASETWMQVNSVLR